MKERLFAIAALALLVAARPAEAACATGDAKCFCQKAGGVWRSELAVGDMPVACTLHIDFQGRDRTFNVYIPPNYDGAKEQPVWMHLRGVYSAKWGGELQPQYPGSAILCRDACALWDGMAGGKREGLNPKRADNVIVVYPEVAFDDPNKRTFWSIPWWRCSMGDCVDADVDDVGFLERVAQAVRAKYSGSGELFVSGNSAGGMMVYQLLCESEWFAEHLTAASVFSGGVGEGHQCRRGEAASRVPLLVLHGQDDDVIGYREGTTVDGSPFQAVVDTVKGLVERRGCDKEEGDALASPFFAAQKIECRDYCRPAGGAGMAAAAAATGSSGAKSAGNAPAGAKNAGNVPAAAKNAGNAAAPAATKNAAPAAAGAKNAAAAAGAKNRALGAASPQGAPVRVCSVPGKKHNLYEVIRSFPIDVSAAWFAKAAGSSWGPTPPS